MPDSEKDQLLLICRDTGERDGLDDIAATCSSTIASLDAIGCDFFGALDALEVLFVWRSTNPTGDMPSGLRESIFTDSCENPH